MKQILLIEDEVEIAEVVSWHVRNNGWAFEHVATGSKGLRVAQSREWDLIVLDRMLPELDGLTICRRLRETGSEAPILMLTAKSSDVDRIVGLESGADDYLTKPFNVMELIARAKAIFRRTARQPSGKKAEGPIACGDFVIDASRRRATLHGEPIALTAKEFELLSLLAGEPGRVYSRAQLLEKIWGYGHKGYEHTVNTHINRLRAKIERDPSQPRFLQTVWGVGYRFYEPHA